jgi:hypothetical protein
MELLQNSVFIGIQNLVIHYTVKVRHVHLFLGCDDVVNERVFRGLDHTSWLLVNNVRLVWVVQLHLVCIVFSQLPGIFLY